MTEELKKTNQKLVELFAKKNTLATDSEEFKQCFDFIIYEIAVNAKFVMIVQYNKDDFISDGKGAMTALKESPITFGTLSPVNSDEDYLALYTSYETLLADYKKSPEQLQTFINSFDDIYNILFKLAGVNLAGIVINPHTDSFVLNKNIIQTIKERKEIETRGHTQFTVPKNTNLIIEEPNPYPQLAVNKLCEYASTKKEIKAIWVKKMLNTNKDNEESTLFIVHADENIETIFPEMSEILREYIDGFIDLISYEQAMQFATGTAFYQRD
ncbi:MAG: enhanced serine sensitivity protein SseB C-terminal domain-containing protein [Cardiobacteriaceae bacterium]|nr:enhanced serine sensitivity protein SseB C-terminal domain-containing protein [Cardiobacteriaceae bacterium]